MFQGASVWTRRFAESRRGLRYTLARRIVAPILVFALLGFQVSIAQVAPKRQAAEELLAQAQAARSEIPASSLRRAISLFQQAEVEFAKTGNVEGQVTAFLGAASVWRDLSDFQRALAVIDKAKKVARTDRHATIAVLNARARMWLDLWESEKAEADAEEALKLSRAAGDRRGEAPALIERGEAHYLLTDDAPATRDLSDGAAIAESEGDEKTVALATRAMAWVEEDQGHFRRVIELMRRAGDLFRTVKDLRAETLAAIEVASMQSLVGERESVLSAHTGALRLARVMGQRLMEAWALEALGNDYARLSKPRTAIGYFHSSLAIFRQVGHRSGQFSSQEVLCRSELAVGEAQAANRDCTQALVIAKALHDPKRQAVCMKSLADTEAAIGHVDEALDLYRQAAELSHRVNDTRFEAMARLALGRLREKSGDRSSALSEYQSALSLSAAAETTDVTIDTRCAIARLHRNGGDLDQSRSELEGALRLAEEQRSHVGSEALRSSYFTSVRQAYELYAQVLMDLHEKHAGADLDRQALEQSEKAHARGLLDALAQRAASAQENADPDVVRRMRDLRARIEEASEERMRLLAYGGTKAKLDANMERIRLLNSEYDAASGAASETRGAGDIPSLTTEQIQRVVIDGDTTLLEYLLGDDGGIGWAVTSHGVVSFRLPARAELEKDVKRWHDLMLARRPRPGDTAESFRVRVHQSDRELQTITNKLSCILVRPAQLNTRRLAVVTDGALEYLAFAALMADGCAAHPAQRLASEKEIVVLPSASSLAALRRDAQARTARASGIAVLADPVFGSDDPRVGGKHAAAAPRLPGALGAALRDIGWAGGIPRLPGTREEAKAIAARAPGARVLLDFEANLGAALNPSLGHYRILHFATHGLLDAEQPEFSGLILSLVDAKGKDQNGYLSARDIYDQHLSSELVVLSACDSGLGETLRGEGMVGLARAFLHAGSSRVVSSLWKVDDDATSELMRDFYDAMLRDGMPASAALRYAQKRMMQQKRWSAPFYWAGFVLSGEWQ